MVQPHRRPHTALAASQPLLSKYYYSVFLMENLCVRYGNLVFLVVNSKNVAFFVVKNRCVRYGCVRYDGTPI